MSGVWNRHLLGGVGGGGGGGEIFQRKFFKGFPLHLNPLHSHSLPVLTNFLFPLIFKILLINSPISGLLSGIKSFNTFPPPFLEKENRLAKSFEIRIWRLLDIFQVHYDVYIQSLTDHIALVSPKPWQPPYPFNPIYGLPRLSSLQPLNLKS